MPLEKSISRRRLIQQMAGVSALATSPAWMRALAADGQQANGDDKILVVFELSGGNDGLNSIVPFRNDDYYRHRPTIGLKRESLLTLDDDYGFNPGMLGMKRLWDQGQLALIHGCGYESPSYSHFTSMAYLHTASPNSGSSYGWVGRLADQMDPSGSPNFIVNVDSRQSLAVASRKHTPVVFDDPSEFQRRQFGPTPPLAAGEPLLSEASSDDNRAFLRRTAAGGALAAEQIRSAWNNYSTPVDYGIVPLDLKKIAACIAADLPTRLYYTAFRNNAFDTHVQQGPLHKRLLTYACDAIYAFIADLERQGLADRVVVLAFSEFGRRVGENTNSGTDHGTANMMFLAGKPVKGGHYGAPPSLSALREDLNLQPTTDFRRVYATGIEWLAPGLSQPVLNGGFEPFPALV